MTTRRLPACAGEPALKKTGAGSPTVATRIGEWVPESPSRGLNLELGNFGDGILSLSKETRQAAPKRMPEAPGFRSAAWRHQSITRSAAKPPLSTPRQSTASSATNRCGLCCRFSSNARKAPLPSCFGSRSGRQAARRQRPCGGAWVGGVGHGRKYAMATPAPCLPRSKRRRRKCRLFLHLPLLAHENSLLNHSSTLNRMVFSVICTIIACFAYGWVIRLLGTDGQSPNRFAR